MNLFNPYNNYIFTELIRYINKSMLGEPVLSKEDFENTLLREALHLPEDSISALTNSFSEDFSLRNTNLFFENDNAEFVSVLNWSSHLPIRLSKAESSWLYYAINDPRSSIFISYGLKQELNNILKQTDIIDISKYIVEKSQSKPFDEGLIDCICNVIIYSITTQRSVIIDQSDEYIVFKVMFNQISNKFTLVLYPVNTPARKEKDIKLYTITDPDKISFGPPIALSINNETYIDYINAASSCLKLHQQEAIHLQLLSYKKTESTMADDRCAYLFSSYDTTAYIDEKDNLNMKICYYDFQENEVIDNILSLGKYVKVISPSRIVNRIKSLIK